MREQVRKEHAVSLLQDDACNARGKEGLQGAIDIATKAGLHDAALAEARRVLAEEESKLSLKAAACALQLVMWCVKVGNVQRSRGWHLSNGSLSWLDRWWSFAGHSARGVHREVPGAASIIDSYRAREWWLEEQSKATEMRIQRPRHFPKLSNLEKDMNLAAGGCYWTAIAGDRVRWQQL